MFQQTADQRLLHLANLIFDNNYFDNFQMVGGTAISLQLGHRLSVDIVLFSESVVDTDYTNCFFKLNPDFKTVDSRQLPFGSMYFIEIEGLEIKVDVMCDGTKFIGEQTKLDNINIASIDDISAMKLNAIINRKVKKDYWDIAYLSKQMTFNQMIKKFQEKFYFNNENDVISSILDSEKADNDNNPIDLNGKTWEEIKQDISKSFSEYIKTEIEPKFESKQQKKSKGLGL